MAEYAIVEPGKVVPLRFKIIREGFTTIAIESPTEPVWLLGLTVEGYNAYRRGTIKPPSSDPATTLGTLEKLLDPPPKGSVLFASPPTHAFAHKVSTFGLVGLWYVLIGNRGKQTAEVRYEAWE
jgi:hypothetical protein